MDNPRGLPPDEALALIKLLGLEVVWHGQTDCYRIMITGPWEINGYFYSVDHDAGMGEWRKAIGYVLDRRRRESCHRASC